MHFQISGLPVEPFHPYFAMSDAELLSHGARRMRAEAGGAPMPCRISLLEAEPGETTILLNYLHLPAPASPYRAAGPIFVREAARETARFLDEVPEQVRTRLLSVRAYDADGWMLDAEVAEGTEIESLIERFFAQSDVAFLHAHNARRGCYNCRIDRT